MAGERVGQGAKGKQGKGEEEREREGPRAVVGRARRLLATHVKEEGI